MSGTVSMHEVPLQPRPHAEGLGYSPNTVYNDRTRIRHFNITLVRNSNTLNFCM